MRRFLVIVSIVFVCFAQVGAAGATESGTPQYLGQSRQVVLILAPFVTWADIDGATTPHLFALAATSPIGNINARSRVKDIDGKPSLLEGALAISSGAWSRVDLSAREAYDVTEQVDGVSATDIYMRLMGQSAGDARIVYLGLPRILAANASGDFTVIPGLLGSAIEQAGGATAAIGNSDLGFTSSSVRQMRPAAVVAMNKEGLVRYGSVSAALLRLDYTAPFGLRTDLEELEEQMKEVATALPSTGPSLIVIDPGDLYRAQAARAESSALAAEMNWVDALATLDATYANARDVFEDATIIVTSQAALHPELKREGLGPVILSQPETPGLITSDATQRAGLVTNLDLSATIYALLGIPSPIEVIGSPLQVRAVDFDRLEHLIEANNTALSIDVLRATVVNTIIWITVGLLVVGALLLVWAERNGRTSLIKRMREVLEIIILGCLSIPAASWAMFLIDRWPQTPNQVVAQLIAAVMALWIISIVIWRVFGRTSGIIFLGVVTSAIIIVDQMLGAPLSFSGFLSYSPILAFRFYGLGNEGAALLFGASLIAFVLWLDRLEKPRRYTTWFLVAGAFLIMLICAAPWWGANVGVAAWATVGFSVLFLLANGRKVTMRNVMLMVMAIVLIVGVFILIDRFGSRGETHLARAVGSAQAGGVTQLVEIIVRKMQTNLRVLTASLWGAVFVAVIGFLAFWRSRPTPELARTLERNPYFAAGMTALLVGGVIAFFTEDSGIVLPAIMVLYLGCALLWLMLERLDREGHHGRLGDEGGLTLTGAAREPIVIECDL